MTTHDEDNDHSDRLLNLLCARADVREQSRALARAIDVLRNSSQATSPCLSTCVSSLTKVRRILRGELGEIRRKLSQQRKRDDLKEAARLAAARLAALGEHLRRAPVSVSPTYMDALDDQHHVIAGTVAQLFSKRAQEKQEQQKTDRRRLDDILKELGKDPNVVVCQLDELGDWLQKLWPDKPEKQETAKDSGSES